MKAAALLALTIAAASSTRPVLEKRRDALASAAGAPVVFVFGGTGALARQLENGAPFDLFLAADTETPALLAKEGHLDPATVRTYAKGALVLVADPRRRLPLPKVLDRDSARALFARPFRRLAIAAPRTAPYGRAAMEALARAGVLELVKGRLVEAESVEQARAYVASGNVDLGLVAASVVAPGLARVPVAPSLYDPIVHAGGVASRSPRKAAARRVFEALTAPGARSLWEELGYTVP